MDLTQLNSTKDTPYFCIPKEFATFEFWQLGSSINGFVIKIVFTLILELISITFVIYFILRLYLFISVFIKDLANIFRNVLYILYSLGFYRYLYFTCC